jgi:7,8-dihydroneopterin aldolase/epimerase/oxygenase
MDKIVISNYHLRTIIGVYEHERRKPQDIILNITLYLNTRPAGKKDDLRLSVDYADLIDSIRSRVSVSSTFTVEALAEEVAKICLGNTRVKKVDVRVEKPHVIKGVERVGVEITRARS